MVTKYLCLLMLPLVLLSANANQNPIVIDRTIIRDRLLLEGISYRILEEISLYSIHDGDPKIKQRIQDLLGHGNGYADHVKENWPHLSNQWHSLRLFTLESLNVEVQRKADYNARLSEQVKSVENAFSQAPIDLKTIHAEALQEHMLLITLERMLAYYTLFHNNLFGGHASRFGIEEQVESFDSQLQNLTNQRVKKDIEGQWAFIKKTVLAYNRQSAIYIVDRVGEKIRASLLLNLER